MTRWATMWAASVAARISMRSDTSARRFMSAAMTRTSAENAITQAKRETLRICAAGGSARSALGRLGGAFTRFAPVRRARESHRDRDGVDEQIEQLGLARKAPRDEHLHALLRRGDGEGHEDRGAVREARAAQKQRE